ncbi:MAG: MBL fold metallo-hydrolase [Pseudomonadota bacterium]
MMRILTLLGGAVAIALAAGLWVWNTHQGQDWLLEKAAAARLRQQFAQNQPFDGLKVFMCGTSSPIPSARRAQACVAVLAGERLYLVDAGAGSVNTLMLAGIALERLDAVLLTHFHSDHVAALPDVNLNSWVAGRPEPLLVYGPAGVDDVVAGFNTAYQLDREYRVAHHGFQLLPPEVGKMQARTIPTAGMLELGDLTITVFPVDHAPVVPAVGYRFDYRGRSVVVSGDSTVTPTLVEAATGADLLLQDALSLPIIQAMEKAAGGTRLEVILHDIQDYHAHAADLPALLADTGVTHFAVYHLIPPPDNPLLKKIFKRDLPRGTTLTEDGMVFELAAGGRDVAVIHP